ncbi:Alternative oxidase 1a, mitochondrial [Hordeum vulgare]|nr:Alternative oxidase 1a, mitochondrial [Hordeum vulgare]
MAPRLTSAGRDVSSPVVSRAPISKLPNAPTVKKTINVSGKNKKAVDGSTRPSKKKLARRATNAVATEASASSFVPPTANAHNVFDGMPTCFSDETYMTTLSVGSNNFYWPETNDVHLDDHEFEVDEDGEGIVDAPKQRAGNYTMDEDVLLCNTWLKVSRNATISSLPVVDNKQRLSKVAAALKAVDTLNPSGTNDQDRLTIAQNLFQGEEKKTKKGKIRKGRTFTLPHCYDALKDDEK